MSAQPVEDGPAVDLDEYVRIVGDYADHSVAANLAADRDSMRIARAMDEVFQSGVWVDEWLEQKPEPKRPTNRWNPADRNRFIAWSNWRMEQAGRHGVQRVQSWRLLEAEKVRKICSDRNRSDSGPRAATPYRPLFWLTRNRYEDRAPEVWALAVEYAGGTPRNVTEAHTRQALADWRKKTFGTRKDGTPRKSAGAIAQAANAAGKANRIRRSMLEELAEMYRLASIDEHAKDEYLGMLEDIDKFLDEHMAADA